MNIISSFASVPSIPTLRVSHQTIPLNAGPVLPSGNMKNMSQTSCLNRSQSMIQLLWTDVLHESCMPLVHSQTHGEGHIVLIACVVPNILVQANHQMKSLLLIAMQYSKESIRINTKRRWHSSSSLCDQRHKLYHCPTVHQPIERTIMS